MLLYNYIPHDSYSYITVRLHHGRGIGSVFGRLFSGIAAKTAAKSALAAAKLAGKRVLRVAARQGNQLAKKQLNSV